MKRAVIAVLGVALLVSNCCGPRVHRTPASLPADVQIGLARVDDVWVAGFVANAGKDKMDLNLETVRLVWQDLRRIARGRIVEAEPLTIASQAVLGQSGRTLDATVVVIDGRSGAVVARRPLPQRMRYAGRDLSSGLPLFLEMMEHAGRTGCGRLPTRTRHEASDRSDTGVEAGAEKVPGAAEKCARRPRRRLDGHRIQARFSRIGITCGGTAVACCKCGRRRWLT